MSVMDHQNMLSNILKRVSCRSQSNKIFTYEGNNDRTKVKLWTDNQKHIEACNCWKSNVGKYIWNQIEWKIVWYKV